MWWRKKKQPEFWTECDKADKILHPVAREEALIYLYTENPVAYNAWADVRIAKDGRARRVQRRR